MEHAARSASSGHIIAGQNGHHIQIDQPQSVIEALKQLVDRAR